MRVDQPRNRGAGDCQVSPAVHSHCRPGERRHRHQQVRDSGTVYIVPAGSGPEPRMHGKNQSREKRRARANRVPQDREEGEGRNQKDAGVENKIGNHRCKQPVHRGAREDPGKTAAEVGFRIQVTLEIDQVLKISQVKPGIGKPGRRIERVVAVPEHEQGQRQYRKPVPVRMCGGAETGQHAESGMLHEAV